MLEAYDGLLVAMCGLNIAYYLVISFTSSPLAEMT